MKKEIVLLIISILLTPFAGVIGIGIVLGLGYLMDTFTDFPKFLAVMGIVMSFVGMIYFSGVPESIYIFFARKFSEKK